MDAQLRGTVAAMKILLAVLLAVAVAAPAAAESPEIALRRSLERKTFSDAEILDGFFKTAFGAELMLGRQQPRIRKFDAPVRVFVDSRAEPDRRASIAEIVADIGNRIRHLDIAITGAAADANMVIALVRDRDLPRAIASLYGIRRARQIQTSLAPQCLSGVRKDDGNRIVQSNVILAADTADFIFYDCAYEEILQALGPINDTDTVPWTMFNDQVHMGFFDIYDQYILNIVYDPRIRPGMDVNTVRALMPQILPDVRSWVGRKNNLDE
jgi:hypothetical protein